MIDLETLMPWPVPISPPLIASLLTIPSISTPSTFKLNSTCPAKIPQISFPFILASLNLKFFTYKFLTLPNKPELFTLKLLTFKLLIVLLSP